MGDGLYIGYAVCAGIFGVAAIAIILYLVISVMIPPRKIAANNRKEEEPASVAVTIGSTNLDASLKPRKTSITNKIAYRPVKHKSDL